MRHLFLLLFFFLSCFTQAQTADSGKVIGLHPSVGKIISQEEKLRYHLFPDYKDNVFQNAKVIKYNDSTFILSVSTVTGKEVQSPITTTELDDLYYQIEDAEKAKRSEEEYVMTEEEKKEIKKKRVRQYNSTFWYNFLAQMTILTIEVVLAIAAGS
ncbi:MAG: hypothetical protein K0Q95_66 [Bacteroidota bacterium]|jgi:hypothetical protein|nr:hypothetical protein [Bacteroidota bacterium]